MNFTKLLSKVVLKTLDATDGLGLDPDHHKKNKALEGQYMYLDEKGNLTTKGGGQKIKIVDIL